MAFCSPLSHVLPSTTLVYLCCATHILTQCEGVARASVTHVLKTPTYQLVHAFRRVRVSVDRNQMKQEMTRPSISSFGVSHSCASPACLLCTPYFVCLCTECVSYLTRRRPFPAFLGYPRVSLGRHLSTTRPNSAVRCNETMQIP